MKHSQSWLIYLHFCRIFLFDMVICSTVEKKNNAWIVLMKMTEKLLYPPCHQTVQLLTGEEGEQANSEQRHRETEGQGGEVCPTKTINMLDCSWTQHTINNTITMCNNNRTITDNVYLCTVLHVFIYIYIYVCVRVASERPSIWRPTLAAPYDDCDHLYPLYYILLFIFIWVSGTLVSLLSWSSICV